MPAWTSPRFSYGPAQKTDHAPGEAGDARKVAGEPSCVTGPRPCATIEKSHPGGRKLVPQCTGYQKLMGFRQVDRTQTPEPSQKRTRRLRRLTHMPGFVRGRCVPLGVMPNA